MLSVTCHKPPARLADDHAATAQCHLPQPDGHWGGRRLGRAAVTHAFLTAVLLGVAAAPGCADGAPMPRISVHGQRLYAGATPWRAWGFNWGIGNDMKVLYDFDDPTASRLRVLSSELRTARLMGANSMRVYLELGQVMQSPNQARPSTLTALRLRLWVAERDRVYLDITGDLVWLPKRSPAWYDALSEQARWQVQANFWTAIVRTAASSPAVLCYELTSEPIVSQAPGYYLGDIAGWTFVQSIAIGRRHHARALARAWTSLLAGAVRHQDNRPVSIGLLPTLTGAFAPQNVADLLDMLIVHQYPQTDTAQDAVSLTRRFSRFHKPLLLGETFLLNDDVPTQSQFLLATARYLVGAFEFYDGRDPSPMAVTCIPDAIYRTTLRQFISLRAALLEPR